MRPVTTKDATHTYHAPNGWDENLDGLCGSLSVRVEEVGRRRHYISTWTPSPEEVMALRQGSAIEIRIVDVQPPLAVSVLPISGDMSDLTESELSQGPVALS
jgi:hypothetical protein